MDKRSLHANSSPFWRAEHGAVAFWYFHSFLKSTINFRFPLPVFLYGCRCALTCSLIFSFFHFAKNFFAFFCSNLVFDAFCFVELNQESSSSDLPEQEMSPPILSLALPSATGRVLSIQSHTVQVCSIVYDGCRLFGSN